MRFNDAIELYLRDMASQGRLTSRGSERAYRDTLKVLADEISNRDPQTVNRADVKRVLRRWSRPNTQRKHRSVMVSFFDWSMEQGYRKDNPARQTQRPKRRPTKVYRLTREEATMMLQQPVRPANGERSSSESAPGFETKELRGLQGRHFGREGWVWVSSDVAKGRRERWRRVGVHPPAS